MATTKELENVLREAAKVLRTIGEEATPLRADEPEVTLKARLRNVKRESAFLVRMLEAKGF